ncbi:MAG TPA: histidine kinase [Daejeonella sp.]|nr:histidine kinase [Daejeonella sp.]
MNLNDFIFSDKAPEKYFRHFAFWITWYLVPVTWDCVLFGVIQSDMTWSKLLWTFVYRLFDLGFNITYCYLVVYLLIPKFLVEKKYGSFIFWISTFTITVYFLYIQGGMYLANVSQEELPLLLLNFSRNFITSGPPVICAFFVTLKILKGYYSELEEKTSLIQENSKAELQLLKAQVHPHFLFNTLNNIYSFTLNSPQKAAGLVSKLSHTIKYMTYDCEAELVPLEKEIGMIKDYIGLEKVRYGERLKLKVNITGDSENKLISPLLLIPFVENSFKHGSSKIIDSPWIAIEIDIQDNVLNFSISNSKPENIHSLNGLKGIGLTNVQKRLQLLYPGQHLLEIHSDEYLYQVKLTLPLHLERVEERQPIEATGRVLTETYATG